MKVKLSWKLMVAPLAVAVIVAACGGGDPTSTPQPTATTDGDDGSDGSDGDGSADSDGDTPADSDDRRTASHAPPCIRRASKRPPLHRRLDGHAADGL